MAISLKDVEHVAKLARLEFTPEEKETFTHQLNKIVGYIEKLNKLDTAGVRPFTHVLDLSNVMRDDRTIPSLPQAAVLGNAPDRTENFFKVPKVIG
jgi:aspartyl-tRNA(Asn)/glutamyl-tRNA(Gln) amidotransferase subunit C